MSYLEWKSFEKSRLEEELGLEDAGELKSASDLLLSCRRLKARKASKSKGNLFIKSELSIWTWASPAVFFCGGVRGANVD